MSTNDKLFDVRLVKHHLRRQVLNQSTLDAELNELEDSAEFGEETETRFQPNGPRAAAAETHATE